MVDAVQIKVDVDPLFDMEPTGDGHRRAKHHGACGAWLVFRRHSASCTYSLKCPCCGPLGEVQSSMIDCIDRAAIRGDGAPVTIDVWS